MHWRPTASFSNRGDDMTKPRRCTVCQGELRPATLDLIHGEEGALELSVRKMPVLECEQGHRAFVNADFPLLLLDHLLEQDEPRLPASETKGLVFKHFHCSSCGAELGQDTNGKRTFKLPIDLLQQPTFEVELTLPVHRCAKCGHEQIHALKEARGRTPAALAHAFKSAQIAHG
jgi:predicted RNA-binding Zn-ribbon protein involved in translation (DUF1610 family)